jgi:hypothetical protein
MTKFSLLGVAAVAYAALAVPAFAQHKTFHPANTYAQTEACAGYESGNPYNRDTDFLSWSAWRVRGGWDDRNDYKCTQGR